jgi:formylglycine-generating enzyme required for sulfatase activity
VTQAQYEKVMKDNPSSFHKGAGGGPDHPVDHVSYSDAKQFCDALNALPEERKAGRRYRLPTQAEWEHAARAGAKTKYHAGDEKADLDAVGWFKDNSAGKTAEVGKKKPNDFGLYDMHGNVMEWCADRVTGDDGKPRHVLRGGSFNLGADDCTLGASLKTRTAAATPTASAWCATSASRARSDAAP